MSTLDLRTNSQKLADADAFHDLEKQRAASTVCSRVAEPEARQELLACLGLLDAPV